MVHLKPDGGCCAIHHAGSGIAKVGGVVPGQVVRRAFVLARGKGDGCIAIIRGIVRIVGAYSGIVCHQVNSVTGGGGLPPVSYMIGILPVVLCLGIACAFRAEYTDAARCQRGGGDPCRRLLLRGLQGSGSDMQGGSPACGDVRSTVTGKVVVL